MNTHSRRFVLALTLLVFFGNQNSAADNVDPRFDVTIEKTHNKPFGQIEDVRIYLDNNVDPGYGMGGYDFLIEFDHSALSFISADPGQLITDCGWEYFTYRYGASGNCGTWACPSGKIRIVAVAETNNGNNHPSCYGETPGASGDLAILHFLVTNDFTYECQLIPIRFAWYDCGDNAVSSVSGDSLFISNHIYDLNGNDLANPDNLYPTNYGANWSCDTLVADSLPTILRYVDFYNGGVSIICYDTIDDRGDVNLNGLPFEIADALLFENYFLYGMSAFTINAQGQIAASDINRDGETLKLEDLVQLKAISIGQLDPDSTIDSTIPVGALLVQDFDTKTISVAHNTLTDLIWLRFNGEIVPKYVNNDFVVSHQVSGSDTRVLVENLQESIIYDLSVIFNYSGDGIVGEVQGTKLDGWEIVTYLDQCLPGDYCYDYEFMKIGDLDLNALTCEMDDLVLFSQFFTLGEQVFTFNQDIQFHNTDINTNGEFGEIADFIMLHRAITDNGPCSIHFDSVSPNIATFTQRADPGRGYESFIDLETVDSIGAVQLIFKGDITVTSSNSNADAGYYYQNGHTTVLIFVNPEHSLDSTFIVSGQLISYTGASELIIARTATYTGVKVNSNIDFSSDIGDNDNPTLPGQFLLHQNYPNPFNNRTVIDFDLPHASDVDFAIVNLLGQIVFTLHKRYSAGSHSMSWDGVDNAGKTVGSGVYYYRIIAGDFVESKKMILLK